MENADLKMELSKIYRKELDKLEEFYIEEIKSARLPIHISNILSGFLNSKNLSVVENSSNELVDYYINGGKKEIEKIKEEFERCASIISNNIESVPSYDLENVLDVYLSGVDINGIINILNNGEEVHLNRVNRFLTGIAENMSFVDRSIGAKMSDAKGLFRRKLNEIKESITIEMNQIYKKMLDKCISESMEVLKKYVDLTKTDDFMSILAELDNDIEYEKKKEEYEEAVVEYGDLVVENLASKEVEPLPSNFLL